MQRYTTIQLDKKPGEWRILLVPVSTPATPTIPISVPADRPEAVRVPETRKYVPLCQQPFADHDPLAVWVAKAGGINPDYANGWRHGEVKMIQDCKKGLPPGAINRNASLTLEELAEWACAHGYITEGDPNKLLEALLDDCTAAANNQPHKRIYSFAGQETVKVGLLQAQHDATFADDAR